MHTLTIIAALSLSASAQAAPKYVGPFGVQGGCVGCPKGDKVALAPAVIEFLLASPDSPVLNHYAHIVKYSLGEIQGSTKNNGLSKNIALTGMWTGDLQYIMDTYGATVGDKPIVDADERMEASRDGVIPARAVRYMIADDVNQRLLKKGQAMWLWGSKWEEQSDGTWTTPTIAGVWMNALVPHADTKTVDMHYFNARLKIKPDVTWDFSDVDGAFDPTSDLSYDEVVAGAKRAE